MKQKKLFPNPPIKVSCGFHCLILLTIGRITSIIRSLETRCMLKVDGFIVASLPRGWFRLKLSVAFPPRTPFWSVTNDLHPPESGIRLGLRSQPSPRRIDAYSVHRHLEWDAMLSVGVMWHLPFRRLTSPIQLT